MINLLLRWKKKNERVLFFNDLAEALAPCLSRSTWRAVPFRCRLYVDTVIWKDPPRPASVQIQAIIRATTSIIRHSSSSWRLSTRFLTLIDRSAYALCLFHEASISLLDIHRPARQSPSFSLYLTAKKNSLTDQIRDRGMSPDPPAAPLAQTLIAIRDATAQLGLLLRPELLENSAAKCAFDELFRSVSRSISLAADGSTSRGGERKSSSASYNERRIRRRTRWRRR